MNNSGTNESYKIIVRDAGNKNIVGTYRPNIHNNQFSIVLHPGFYIFDLYINDIENQSFEYIIKDREPLKTQISLSVYIQNK